MERGRKIIKTRGLSVKYHLRECSLIILLKGFSNPSMKNYYSFQKVNKKEFGKLSSHQK